MLWWFEKNGKCLAIEILQLVDGGYELQFVDEDGTEHVERFSHSSQLARRQREIEAVLGALGWSPGGRWIA